MNFVDRLEKFQRDSLKEAYVQLPFEKKLNFDKIYGKLEKMNSGDIICAISLIERTLIKIEEEA